jgi:hypothetical protein
MTTMPDVITAPQAERHNRRRKGYPLPGSYWDRVQRGPPERVAIGLDDIVKLLG